MSRSARYVGVVITAVVSLLGGCSKSGSPTAPGNYAPSISVNVDKLKLYPTHTGTVTAVASDVDGDQLTFAYTASGGTVRSSGPTARTATFTAGSQPGPARVTVVANDGRGGSSTGTADLYVQNPATPAFTVEAVSVPGGPETTMYMVLTTPEAVTIDGVEVRHCYTTSSNFSGPVNLPAGGHLEIRPPAGGGWPDVGSQPGQCQLVLAIDGHRAEPDGGSFYYFGYAH